MIERNNFQHNLLPLLQCSINQTLLVQSKNETDSDSIINILSVHPLKQVHLLHAFQGHNNSDAEKFKNDFIKNFTQTEFEKSLETKISANHILLAPHGFFSTPENLTHKPASQCSSSKFDVDDELSAKTETMHVNFTSPDYLSCYSATNPRENPSEKMPKRTHASISTYIFPQKVWHSPEKKLAKKSFTKYFKKLPPKIKTIPKTIKFTFIRHRTLQY